jgi:serine/threonine protein kinase
MVYKASDLQSDMRHVAVKLFAESQAHTRLRAEFFGRECRALQELRHPSIIELFDWGVDETTGERFLVLDWMEDTLDSRQGKGRLGARRRAGAARAIAPDTADFVVITCGSWT